MNLSSTEKMAPSAKELRLFALATLAVVLLLEKWYGGGWLGLVGQSMAIYTALGMGVPVILRPLYHGMTRLGMILGFVNIRIILGLTYYLIFTPLAIYFKLVGRDKLHLKKKECKSFWEPYDGHPSTLERYRRLF